MRWILAVGGLALMAGCANDSTVHEVDIGPPAVAFTDAEFAWSTAAGANSVTGDAALRTSWGNVKTCAGLEVVLIPRTPFDTALIANTFTSDDADISPGDVALRKLAAAPPGVTRYWRRANCDSVGRFAFRGLPDGDYYLTAEVTWDAPGVLGGTVTPQVQGGVLMQRVHLAGGTENPVTLTGQIPTDGIFH